MYNFCMRKICKKKRNVYIYTKQYSYKKKNLFENKIKKIINKKEVNFAIESCSDATEKRSRFALRTALRAARGAPDTCKRQRCTRSRLL